MRPPSGVDHLVAAVAYDEVSRPMVAGVKYRGHRAAVSWLASAMVSVSQGLPLPHAVTWVPTSAPHRRERGFDHAELLARAVARRLEVPTRRLLVRRDARTQTGRRAADRIAAAPVFAPVGGRTTPPVVAVVDDIVTTGATLASAASALRDGGARTVISLVAAATPLPGAVTR
ncbi:MAG: ComF family protein [Acidimicrobiales bacterium]